MVATESGDVMKLQSIYKAVATQRGQTPLLTPALTQSEAAASKLYPRHTDPNPYDDFSVAGGRASGGRPSMHGGHREYGLYDEEAINFADGSRSILDIRDAISAELGAIDVKTVETFFRDLEKTGKWIVGTGPTTRSAAEK